MPIKKGIRGFARGVTGRKRKWSPAGLSTVESTPKRKMQI